MEISDADVLSISDTLEKIKKDVNALETVNVSQKALLTQINEVSKHWLKDISGLLTLYGIEPEVVEKYSTDFKALLRLSYKPNRRKTILTNIELILKGYIDDIVMPVQINDVKNMHSELHEILEQIKDNDENEYLKEAIDCAEEEHYRAAVILGWCAAIDRIHKAIEIYSFEKFSAITQMMKEQKNGRFKRFNKCYVVSNMSEMQEVFDNDVLLSLEAMGYIDNNQNTRLSGCYNMRCNCGHPGNAPMTKFNVMSFFSDLLEIIYKNPKFDISSNTTIANNRAAS